jgi:hypothetical protein
VFLEQSHKELNMSIFRVEPQITEQGVILEESHRALNRSFFIAEAHSTELEFF